MKNIAHGIADGKEGGSEENSNFFKIAIILTGGTISKKYDPFTAKMKNCGTTVIEFIRSLRIEETRFEFISLIDKDSLDFDDADRESIAAAVVRVSRSNDAVVIVHGTDSLTQTADIILKSGARSSVPVIFTGAMIPHVIRNSDASQNMTEALFACRLLKAGIYLVFHGRVLKFPGVVKDYDTLTFRSIY